MVRTAERFSYIYVGFEATTRLRVSDLKLG